MDQLSSTQSVLPPTDELRLFWPRPKFRKLAIDGVCSTRCALVHMCIYDSLGTKPATVDFVDLRFYEWRPLWREAILLMKQFWDDRQEDLKYMEHKLHSRLKSMVAGPKAAELAIYAGGKATKASVDCILPLKGLPRARAEFHERLGWPHNSQIGDKDAFDVWEVRSRLTGEKCFRAVRWEGSRRGLHLGDNQKFMSRTAAETALPWLVQEYVDLRDGVIVPQRGNLVDISSRQTPV